MIGQGEVLSKLKTTPAKSVLLTGPAHWGKKTLLRELFQKEESVYEIVGNSATFRESLERIYQTVRPTVYLIPDLDKSNATIQNILLKVLEEPPRFARFFLTASGTVLPTITSRCVTYRMLPYSDSELSSLETKPALTGFFKSPGEYKLLDVDGMEDILRMVMSIKDALSKSTLAFVLKLVKELNWKLNELNIPQDTFLLVAQNVFKGAKSLNWLRSQPNDAVRYVRCQFFMRLWLELQEG